MLKKIISLMAIATMLMSLVVILPVSADVVPSFGDLADFSDEYFTTNHAEAIAAGDAISTGGWVGADITNPKMDTPPAEGSAAKQMKITSGIIQTTGGAGSDSSDTACISLPTSATSSVELKSPVTPGKNYVITFYTKTVSDKYSDPLLHLSIDYELFYTGHSIASWTSVGYHKSVNDCSRLDTVVGHENWLTGQKEHSGTVCGSNTNFPTEGHYCENIGYGKPKEAAEWVKNQYEIYVPHCADVLNVKILKTEKTGTALVDNFSIEEASETNLILNGSFDYTGNKSFYSMNHDVDPAGADYTTGNGYNDNFTAWEVVRCQAGDNVAKVEQVTDNGNNYLKVTAPSDKAQAPSPGQLVTLDPGIYKLSFDRNNISDDANASSYVMIGNHRASANGVNAAEPFLSSGFVFSGFNNRNIPISGCSFLPRNFRPQTAGSGWQSYETYFEITERRMVFIAFGYWTNHKKGGSFALDNVKLERVTNDVEMRLVKSADATFADAEHTLGTTWNADAVIENITSVDAGGTVKPIFTVKKDAEGMTGDIITAVYKEIDGYKILHSIDSETFTVPANKFGLVTPGYELTVPAGGNYTVKSFIWNSLTGLDAITESLTVE